MSARLIIGLMSGTSVDAIDAALVRISRQGGNWRMEVLAHHQHPWPPALRRRLLAVMAPASTTTAEICQLHFLVATQCAAAVTGILAATGHKQSAITAVAAHGQTVCHLPPTRPSGTRRLQHRKPNLTPSTLQLGDPCVLATLTGIATIANFRAADMAVGGQGAPLVPFADAMLLSHPTKTRAIQNIGGIANVTFLPGTPAGKHTQIPDDVLAFDTGPGNMLLDAVVSLASGGRRRCDRDGALAARGTLDMRLFRKLQAHPYFEQRPPKSTGREVFGIQLAQRILREHSLRTSGTKHQRKRLPDLLHTLTRLTAWSIADAYLHFLPTLPEEVILCGGGADNPTLVGMLQDEFAQWACEFTGSRPPAVLRIDDLGIPNKAKEAASFALLGAATLDGIPANLPGVTGASRPVILGALALPLKGPS